MLFRVLCRRRTRLLDCPVPPWPQLFPADLRGIPSAAVPHLTSQMGSSSHELLLLFRAITLFIGPMRARTGSPSLESLLSLATSANLLVAPVPSREPAFLPVRPSALSVPPALDVYPCLPSWICFAPQPPEIFSSGGSPGSQPHLVSQTVALVSLTRDACSGRSPGTSVIESRLQGVAPATGSLSRAACYSQPERRSPLEFSTPAGLPQTP